MTFIGDQVRGALRAHVAKTIARLASPRLVLAFGEHLVGLLCKRSGAAGTELSEVRSILVVRLDEIGDVVLTTPFLRELRWNAPQAWITLVVKPGTYNLVELCPYVNEVITYNRATKGPLRNLRSHGRAVALAWRYLWRRRFDIAIVPRWDVDYYGAAFMTHVSGARWRVGFTEETTEAKRRRNRGFNRFFSHILKDCEVKHEVEHNLDVVRFLGGAVQEEGLELWLEEEDEAFARDVLRSFGVEEDECVVAFSVGAGAFKRVWPISNFVELGDWLGREYRARLIVVGGKGDECLGISLARGLGEKVINVVGRTTLRQTAALFKCCQLFVGNDAGPMHVAAAAGIPVIQISCHPENGAAAHPNAAVRFGPWGVPHSVLQPKKGLDGCVDGCTASEPHCILGVTVELVKEAVVGMLSRRECPARMGRR